MPEERSHGQPLPTSLARLQGQERVRRFLGNAVRERRLSHAYLFLGAPGAGKLETARALAQCVVCPRGGCGACDECIRVSHGTHPDVRILRPGSAQGYLVEQARELIADTSLSPVRSPSKVYVICEAGLLREGAANALLKTLEEPPADTYFILLARTLDAVLPTIASRCQQVPFAVPDGDAALRAVEGLCGIGGWEARVALAITGTPDAAASFLSSPERRACRRLATRTIAELERDDSWDLLVSAKEIVASVRAPLAAVRDNQESELDSHSDYLSAGAQRQLEAANKRALTARERSGMMEVMAAIDSLLRDVLLRCAGARESVVNEDLSDVIDRIASSSSTEGVLRALAAVEASVACIERNVNPQLAMEVMLINIKEALYAYRPVGEVQVCRP